MNEIRGHSHENIKKKGGREACQVNTQHDHHHPSRCEKKPEKNFGKFHSSHVHIHSHGKQEKT